MASLRFIHVIFALFGLVAVIQAAAVAPIDARAAPFQIIPVTIFKTVTETATVTSTASVVTKPCNIIPTGLTNLASIATLSLPGIGKLSIGLLPSGTGLAAILPTELTGLLPTKLSGLANSLPTNLSGLFHDLGFKE
jgi:hypothetical protein